MDLVKDYDRVEWVYLRLLLQIGLSIFVTDWIMSRVMLSQYSVLINGSSTDFVKGSRGISQGFPLSSLLFLLDIEGLSHMIKKAKDECKIKGVKISASIFITHLLFVDDVLLFGGVTRD